jgi:hypothetical protein
MAALSLFHDPSSLYERVGEVEQLAAMLESLDPSEDLGDAARAQITRDLLEAISGTRDKLDRTAAVLKQYASAAKAASEEAARQSAREKFFERQIERLEGYVLSILTSRELKQLDGNTVTFKSQLNPAKLVIDDAGALTERWLYQAPRPAPVPNNAEIKAALVAGETVRGARLAQSRRLVVR